MKEAITKQLKLTSSAIDLIKMSQRSQHTSIKEALRKMLKCISMLAEMATPALVEYTGEIPSTIEPGSIIRVSNKKNLIKKAEEIAERSKTNVRSNTTIKEGS